MKKYILDLTNCDLPWFPSGVSKVLPVEPGNFEMEMDIVVDEVAEYKKIEKAAARHMINKGKEVEKYPLGFNFSQLPVGAVLTVLAEQ